jgi:hypothetical protein
MPLGPQMKSKKNGTKESLCKWFYFWMEGGLGHPYSFFYLSAARMKQGIVGYIGLG